MGKKNLSSQKIIYLLYLISLFYLFQAILIDLHNVKENGMIDLRNRITGTRLAFKGIDPYFFKWNPQKDPIEFLDPNDFPDLKMSRVTIPPSNFFIFYPIKDLPYNRIKIIWFVLQWIMAFFVLYVFKITTQGGFTKILTLTVGLFFLTVFVFWHNHIEKGQIYIFYLFLVAFSYIFYKKKLDFISGIIMGINIVFRPFFILFVIPFFIKSKWKFILGNIIGAISLLLISIKVFGAQMWQKFFESVNYQSKLHILDFSYIKQYFDNATNPAIETLKKKYYSIYDSSIQGTFDKIFHIKLSPFHLKLALFLFIIFIFLLLIHYRKKMLKTDSLFLIGILIVIFSEYFVPAPRFNYSNITYLFPTLLIAKNYKHYFKIIYGFIQKWKFLKN